jgi:hypothetical protein
MVEVTSKQGIADARCKCEYNNDGLNALNTSSELFFFLLDNSQMSDTNVKLNSMLGSQDSTAAFTECWTSWFSHMTSNTVLLVRLSPVVEAIRRA